MKVNVYYTNYNKTHDFALEAFYRGVPVNKEYRSVSDYEPSDVAVVFGIFKKLVPISFARGNVIRAQKKSNKQVIVIDSGYVKRGSGAKDYYSVGFDGLNGWADFKNHDMPSDRWKKLKVKMKPWRKSGRHVILCGQVPWDASVQHININSWLEDTAAMLKSLTDRPIIYRPHPKTTANLRRINGCETSMRPLYEDLKDAWATVTYNSNAGVESVIAGVPNIYLGDGGMAGPVSEADLTKIESPSTPDRKQWAANLAYTQWTPGEMANGETWRHLFRDEDIALVPRQLV